MDAEQQVRLSFLTEVEQELDQIQVLILGLATDFNPAAVEQALQALHRVKGQAAMMGFGHLSQTAHDLADFFKILRSQGAKAAPTTAVEVLLLRGVDALRLVSRCSRQGVRIDQRVMSTKVQPILDGLHWFLGDVPPDAAPMQLAPGSPTQAKAADPCI